MNEEQAKQFVIKTILEGKKEKIARVVRKFQEVYGKKQHGVPEKPIQPKSTEDLVKVAEEIGLTEKKL